MQVIEESRGLWRPLTTEANGSYAVIVRARWQAEVLAATLQMNEVGFCRPLAFIG